MDQALIIYGNGGHLGDFGVLANALKRDLAAQFEKTIDVQKIDRKKRFFDLLKKPNLQSKIKELHIFSHSIGAGLFLAYGETLAQQQRSFVYDRATKLKRRLTFDDVVQAEIGAVLTDDLMASSVQSDKKTMRANFAPESTIKIWGCNSGVENWTYSDTIPGTQIQLVDPNDTRAAYYWRALNEKNTPKPSIAQAFADFFGVNVFGARSGSHIEVEYKGRWVTTTKYKIQVGHWPSGTLPQKLVPDAGDYTLFQPGF